MRYVFIVSHGMLAEGMHDAVKMLSGNESDEIRSLGLARDMGADEFAARFRELLKPLQPVMIGGMNLALVLTVVLAKDDADFEEIKTDLLEEARASMKVFAVEAAAGNDDEI